MGETQMNALIGMLLLVDILQPWGLPRQWRPDQRVQPQSLHHSRERLQQLRNPFLYLFVGGNKALLQDTGGGDTDTDLIPKLLDQWAKRSKRPVPPRVSP